MPYTVVMDLVSYAISTEEEEMLQHPQVAGVILFARNIRDRAQICELTHAIHRMRPDIIVFIDHEGGNVQRIQRQGFRALMSARAHGDVFDVHAQTGLDIARQYGEIMAHDLIQCGIDSSLAPVLDLHHAKSKIIGQLDRAFHADPNAVAQLTTAYIDGMHAANMPSVGKHFPGHGTCDADSHRELPVNQKTYDALLNSDLKPFVQLIKNNMLDAVMPAHILFPAVDNEHATGYSHHWLQDILRNKLHFNGLIISDCLGMTGADIGDLKTRAEAALHAGCDLLIVANQTRPELKKLLDDLNNLTNAQISQSNTRFEHFKQSIARFNGQTAPYLESSNTSDFFSEKNKKRKPLEPEEKADPRNPTQQV